MNEARTFIDRAPQNICFGLEVSRVAIVKPRCIVCVVIAARQRQP